MIPAAVYILSAATCLACAILLTRGYARSRVRMLMWSAICFAGLTVSNVLLVIDLLLFPEFDLSMLRLLVSDLSLATLVFGLIW